MNLDLTQLYNTLNWHNNQRDFPSGEKVGLFIAVPDHIAAQFKNDAKSKEDTSPAHITLLYIGNLPAMFEEKLSEVVEAVCGDFKSFDVKLGKVRKFTNAEGQKVFHSPIKSNKLQKLHEKLKIEFQFAQLPFSLKYPKFKPHITIEYVDPGHTRRFPEICPEGCWTVDSVWVWGTKQPKLYFLK